MSWASHNPEKYDEIVRNGLTRLFDRSMGEMGFEKETLLTEDQLMAVIETLENCFPEAFVELRDKAHSDICDAEANYFSRMYGG
jgi:hypothetical protein